MGLSSYLIFIGIYSSAISVSEDSKLRASIRKSVEAEVNFIGNIASTEMTYAVTEKGSKKSESRFRDDSAAYWYRHFPHR